MKRIWIAKRVGILCLAAYLTKAFIYMVLSGDLADRFSQVLPTRNPVFYTYEEKVSTEKRMDIYDGHTYERIKWQKSMIIVQSSPPPRNTAKILSKESDKPAMPLPIFTGPFSINDTDPPLNIQFLHLPQNLSALCHTGKELIVFVISSPSQIAQRSAIRKTWATDASHKTSIIFHLGLEKPSNSATGNLTEDISKERMQYDDIIVSNVVEDYYNLTWKTYATIAFTSLYCQQAKCVLKSDSDTVVNIPAMEKLCNKTNSLSILGNCGIHWPIRDPGSKWFTPTWVWSGVYPKFCLGSAYMLVGSNAARQLLAHVNKTKFFRSANFRKMGEDVVWTGIVAEKAQIDRAHTLGFSPESNANFHCFADGEKAALTVHYIRGLRSIIERWKFVRKPRKC